MRAVIQRVIRAEVRVDGRVAGGIGRGLLVLIGIGTEDTLHTRKHSEKVASLRVFNDESGKSMSGQVPSVLPG